MGNRVLRKNENVSFYGPDLNTSKTADLWAESLMSCLFFIFFILFFKGTNCIFSFCTSKGHDSMYFIFVSNATESPSASVNTWNSAGNKSEAESGPRISLILGTITSTASLITCRGFKV